MEGMSSLPLEPADQLLTKFTPVISAGYRFSRKDRPFGDPSTNLFLLSNRIHPTSFRKFCSH